MDFLQIVFSTVVSAAVLFVLAKISGHKQVAQLDFFDYISGITGSYPPKRYSPGKAHLRTCFLRAISISKSTGGMIMIQLIVGAAIGFFLCSVCWMVGLCL